ncbi:MAG: hypothetical protein E6J91_39555 [Deltaproteobacteria bacterium]|nr:MAG: hypothetical protein E6J91_39555 [Deltaproteobacteria bacterium]
MIFPLPYLTVLAVLLGVGALWWWLSRSKVTRPPEPVAMMVQRIAFPGGIRPLDPERTLAALDKPDDIAIPFPQAVLVIDFPLTTPASVPIESPLPLGFTRAALVKAICDEYAHIYDAEEGTAATKTIPIEERGAMRGRNRTDGAYGIWGHDLQDLLVTAARWTRQSDGTVRIELHVEELK